MQEREARILIEKHDIKYVVIEPAPDKHGWTIYVVDNNESTRYLVSKRSTEPRVFKTSDAALRCCARIGLSQVEVRLQN